MLCRGNHIPSVYALAYKNKYSGKLKYLRKMRGGGKIAHEIARFYNNNLPLLHLD